MDNSVASVLIIAFFASLAPTIAAFAALRSAQYNGHKADDTAAKVVEIHTLTNSNLSRVTSQLELSTQKVEGLQKQVEMLVASKVIADTVAEKAATQSAIAVSEAQHAVPPGMVVAPMPDATTAVVETAPTVTATTDKDDVIVGTFEGKPKKEAKT